MSAITNYFSSFYDFARRHLDLKPKLVDELITLEATATLAGRVITFTVDGQSAHQARVGLGHGNAATRWVGTFNQRASKATPKLDHLMSGPAVDQL